MAGLQWNYWPLIDDADGAYKRSAKQGSRWQFYFRHYTPDAETTAPEDWLIRGMIRDEFADTDTDPPLLAIDSDELGGITVEVDEETAGGGEGQHPNGWYVAGIVNVGGDLMTEVPATIRKADGTPPKRWHRYDFEVVPVADPTDVRPGPEGPIEVRPEVTRPTEDES